MEGNCETRRWDELIPDALGLIFTNLPLQEKITCIPLVCKAWGRVIAGPYCWQEIDIEQWSEGCRPETLVRMLRMLIARSSGLLRKLSVTSLPNDQTLSFVADHAKCLQTLRIPRSEIGDAVVEQVAARLSTVTFLDLSYCIDIGAPAIEALGRNCRLLTRLRRIMHPLEVVGKSSQDDEALAVATTMPGLRQLEMAYLVISTEPVMRIINSCRDLRLLDVRGCWSVQLEDKFVKKFPGLKVVGPHVVDCWEMNSWDDCSNYSGSSGYLAWDFVAGELDEFEDDEVPDGDWDDDESMEDVEMRFYDGFDSDNAAYEWPLSP